MQALGAKRNFGASFRAFVEETTDIQISDAITPRYNHDRCERSVQMRLYTISKQAMALLFALLGTFFTLMVLVGLIGPPITATHSQRYSAKPGWNESKGSVFELEAPHLTPYAQQLWVLAEVVSTDTGASYSSNVAVEVELTGTWESGEKDETSIIRTGNRSHRLRCSDTTCQPLNLAHLGLLHFPHYSMKARFFGLDAFRAKFGLTDVVFYFKSYSPAFSRLEIYIRFFFVVLIFITSVWFFHCLRGYSLHYWALEQRFTAFLLPLLLLYNNPLFPLCFVWESWVPRVMDSVFQCSFLSALLLFWLCVYHGMRQSTRSWGGFYGIKVVLVGLLWTSALSLGFWDRVHQVQDPGFIRLSPGLFQLVKGFYLILGTVYVVYLLYLLTRAFAELRNLPYFDIRLKLFTGLMLVVMTLVVTLSFYNWGLTPAIEDALVSSLRTSYGSSVAFTSSYTLLNLYGTSLAFLYSPNPAVPPHIFFKDDPGVTLLNDSEDELIYNSSEFADKDDDDGNF